MVSSVGSTGSSALLAALMKETLAQQNLEVAVVKKAREVEKMQGEAALKLIDAAANIVESDRIDVRV